MSTLLVSVLARAPCAAASPAWNTPAWNTVVDTRATSRSRARRRIGGTSFYRAGTPKEAGERAGTRTQDHLIKSQVLYQLSYALSEASWARMYGPHGTRSIGAK